MEMGTWSHGRWMFVGCLARSSEIEPQSFVPVGHTHSYNAAVDFLGVRSPASDSQLLWHLTQTDMNTEKNAVNYL